MLPPSMKIGDAVRLKRPHYLVEEFGVDGKETYNVAYPDETAHPPFTIEQLSINGGGSGVYLYETRIKQKSRRAARGFLRNLVHFFFFNGMQVIIRPNEVEVISKFSDTSEVDA